MFLSNIRLLFLKIFFNYPAIDKIFKVIFASIHANFDKSCNF